MKPTKLVVLALSLAALVGCRTDPAIPLLERELRLKEDEIYRLRAEIEDAQCDSQYRGDGIGSRSNADDEPERESSPRRRRGSNGASDMNGIKAPGVELPSTPAGEVPDALKSRGGDALPPAVPDVPDEIQGPSPSSRSGEAGPLLERGSDRVGSRPGPFRAAAGSAGFGVPFMPSADSQKTASIAIERMQTGGIGPNDGSGDRGLLVVVEPRDAAGRTIDAPAEIHVTALDPALKSQGDAARVGRWNFSVAETASLFRRTASGDAIHLAMAWDEKPPKHNKLDLFVRYITADGRALEAHQPVEIALPGDRTARWTPADSPRPAERQPTSEPSARAWRPNDSPSARAVAEPSPRMASRTIDPKPERPVWSPERR